MENYIIAIFAIIFIVIAYYLGKKSDDSVATKQKIDNTLLLQERQSLLEQKQSIKEQIAAIENEYNSKKSYIQNIEEEVALVRLNAEHAQKEKLENLEHEFQKKKEIKEEEHQELLTLIEDEKAKLNHLKQTYKAAIEADMISEKDKAEKDTYRLNISDLDQQDIQILRNIKYQISKPRIIDMLIWQNFYQPIAKTKFPLILGSKVITGIYKITNLNDNKCYIGQAVDVRSRWLEHCKYGLGIDTPQGNKLYQAMLKDGLENFTFELLEECPPELLNQKERFYIELYNSCNFGYNTLKGVK